MHYDNAQSIIRWPCVQVSSEGHTGGDDMTIVILGREVQIDDEDMSMAPRVGTPPHNGV